MNRRFRITFILETDGPFDLPHAAITAVEAKRLLNDAGTIGEIDGLWTFVEISQVKQVEEGV